MGLETSSTADAGQHRLAIGAQLAEQLAGLYPVVAILAVGSTVVGGASAKSDLDIVVLLPDACNPQPAFDNWLEQGVRVEVERIALADALAATGGEGWIWELRRAARLGANAPLHDPGHLGEILRARAASMRPARAPYESQLGAAVRALAALSQSDDPAGKAEALRDALDGLALLALVERPRRYRKAKWTLTDLAHAGEASLRAALIEAYGIHPHSSQTRRTLDLATAVVQGALEALGAPSMADLQGHAPRHLEASYVARTLQDAHDLAQDGRLIEAQFTAKFAARLNVGLLAGGDGVSISAERAQALGAMHAALFADIDYSERASSAAIASARDRRSFLTSLPSAPQGGLVHNGASA